MGNHEQIMLDAIIGQDPLDAETWDINGGWTTSEQLNDMEFEAYEELVRWMAALPLYAVVETEEAPVPAGACRHPDRGGARVFA